MKKLNLLSVAAILSMSLFTATTTFAEEVEPPVDDAKKAESHVKVGIEPGDDKEPTNPIDPEDPDNPGEGGTGQTGNLTIDMVTNLDFGAFKLSSEATTLTANKENKANPTAQVTDKRGTGAGWTLGVEMSDFKSADEHILKGAQLSIPKGELKTNNTDKTLAPENFALVVNKEQQVIMTANKDKGLGTWADSYDKEQTKLAIPAGNYVGEYASTLTWTLSNAPK
ncbi:WxL domain-containing protein [Enterococcus silesiacus]|uniref:WxL domain-containing protein n=1 Tax=Enterococcus silesiacus TaxID=332949 RepID=UPI0009004701|nr:WxL domain-containing protein [Enterococcus silesiacus]